MATKGRFDKRYDPGEFYQKVTFYVATSEATGLSPKPVYTLDHEMYVKPLPLWKENAEDNTQVNESRVKLVTRSFITIDPKITKCEYEGVMYDVKKAETLVPYRHVILELSVKN